MQEIAARESRAQNPKMFEEAVATVNDLYAGVDVETRIVVQQRTSEIKTLMRRTAQDIVDIGQKLIEVNERLEHGLFLSWLRIEFAWSISAAYKFMHVAEQFKFVNFTNLRLAPAALYLLAAPSTPESAREEALLQAEQGTQITHRVAQGIVSAHKASTNLAGLEPAVKLPGLGTVGREQGANGGSGILVQEQFAPLPARDNREPTHQTEAMTDAMAESTHKMAVHFSSRTAEHYTPKNIIASTLTCLGEIDLDPCSNGDDPPNVPACTHYTAADDGLAHTWRGRIYMNPPYGREVGDWVEKLCSEHEAGQVCEAIALLPSRTDTQWWKRLRAYPVCFVQGRLTFVGSQDSAPFPSAVFYLGRDIARFCRAFGHLGDIYQRIEIEEQQ